jgi:hypothetical protein
MKTGWPMMLTQMQSGKLIPVSRGGYARFRQVI